VSIGKDVTLLDDRRSKLWGRNVGPYPLHSFRYLMGTGREAGWPLKLLAAGWDEWVAGCERHRRNSETFALEYVKEGVFVFVQDGRKRALGPGELFITRLGSDSSMKIEGQRARKRTMIGGGSSLRGVLASLGLDKVDALTPSEPERLDALFEKAESCLRDKGSGFAREAASVFYETLLLLGEGLKSESLPEPLRKAIAVFEGSTGPRPSLEELSRLCSCSPATLQRLFKRHFGTSPMERCIAMKMEQAKEMLSVSNLPVKEVARQLGYANQLYFSSEFRKRVGASPSAYRLRPRSDGRP